MKEFKTLSGFAAHLTKLAAFGHEVTDHIAEEGAGLIRNAAKAKLGAYQGPVGPFPAWAPLAAVTIEERLILGFTPNDPLLRSGQLREAIQVSMRAGGATVGVAHGPHVEPGGKVEDVGEIALRMEVGGRTPPRPFLGPAAFESKQKVGRAAGLAMVAWLAGGNWLKPPKSIKLP